MDTATFVRALAQKGSGVGDTAIPILDAPEAWPTVVELAIQHRVAPLVWEALRGDPTVRVPDGVMAHLEEQVWRNRATQMLCEHVLEDMSGRLSAHGVDVLVLKGAALAHGLYPSPELRTYHDLDILCRPADYTRLYQALRRAGYTCEDPAGTLGRTPSPAQSHAVRVFHAPGGQGEIEVHFDLLQFGLRERHHDDFWRAAQTMTAGSLQLRVLAPLHQLLHLTAHVHRHGYSRLIWLIDLDLLIRRHGGRIDWERAVCLARDEGMGAVLWHVLATLHALLGTPWPRLPRPTREEQLLGAMYRLLWPRDKVARLERKERRRLLRFQPGTGDLRDSAYGFILLGRRREKWRIIRRYGSNALGTGHLLG